MIELIASWGVERRFGVGVWDAVRGVGAMGLKWVADWSASRDDAGMVASVQELVAAAFADADMAGLLGRGDWYLVGSRARGFHDDLSDWDTALLTPHDPSPDERRLVDRASLDRVFGIERPPVAVLSDLATNVAWRRSGGVEISIFGPAGRAHREEDGNPIWAYDMRDAIPLSVHAGVGEPYRALVAAAFEDHRVGARDDAYLRFRMARNDAAATLTRSDPIAQAITTGNCAQHASRFWLLAAVSPYPADKWLPAALAAIDGPADLLDAARTVTDATATPDVRYDALWTLWRVIDTRAAEVGVSEELLTGSPFHP